MHSDEEPMVRQGLASPTHSLQVAACPPCRVLAMRPACMQCLQPQMQCLRPGSQSDEPGWRPHPHGFYTSPSTIRGLPVNSSGSAVLRIVNAGASTVELAVYTATDNPTRQSPPPPLPSLLFAWGRRGVGGMGPAAVMASTAATSRCRKAAALQVKGALPCSALGRAILQMLAFLWEWLPLQALTRGGRQCQLAMR